MGESVLVTLARRTGVLAAERELEESARELARGSAAEDRYAAALERFLSLGGGDFDARARSTCADLGLGVDLAREHRGLSGGEKARVALAAILLARFDLCSSTSRRTTSIWTASSAWSVSSATTPVRS